MSEKKIIGLFGVCQTDICIYIASVLQNMGLRVCVVDNSYEQEMCHCIPGPSEELSTITYKNIDYEWLTPPECWQEKACDYLLADLGVWPSAEALRVCQEIYLVFDSVISQLSRYRELMKRVALPMSVIVRDVCPEAVSARRVLAMLQEGNCFVVDSYVLPLSEEDVSCRLAMQYQGYHSFGRLSLAFEKMLVSVCRAICPCESSVIWRSFKRARKGECA